MESHSGSNTASKAVKRAEKAAAKAKAKAERVAEREKEKAEKKHVKSLAQLAENKLLADLKASLKLHARSGTFACGGTLPFEAATHHTDSAPSKDQAVTAESTLTAKVNPVQIRFGESGEGVVVTLPNDVPSEQLRQLIAACQPATFGRGGEEVLDEDYRKAGKLDNTAFATTFCPYAAGIIDVAAQLLLPQTKQDLHFRSIRAELYKLNIYSAPSGKFKAHVDTPRSTEQIGSLVVSLPVDHEGGQLVVRHAGHEVAFDWSASQNSEPAASIKWAAFYSDCEHEVREVTAGHRITLTYNLYATRGLGHLAGSASSLDPTQLPFYATLSAALDTPRFLRRGRVLAIWLTHSYAHTNKHVNFLPSSLKGADMSLYETATALGLRCRLVPVLSLDWSWDGDEPSHHANGKFYGFNEGFGGASLGDEGEHGWGHKMPNGKITWLNNDPSSTNEQKMDRKERQQLRDKEFQEVQAAYLTYGNEPDIDIHYSRAAMLIRVPPYKERAFGEQPPKSFWDGIKRDYNEEYDDYYDDSETSYDSEGLYEEEDDDDDEAESYDDEEGEEEMEGHDAGVAGQDGDEAAS